jgi:uncharacterized protein (TIGR00730 family)
MDGPVDGNVRCTAHSANPHSAICVFCGSSSGAKEAYAAAARDLGRKLAAGGIRLIYGGGHVGLMGTLADETLRAGGQVVGVIPRHLAQKELAHQNLSELIVVQSMHERKQRMADLADAFVALPGGIGTFEELLEIMTWAQLGLHAKPIGILDVAGYYRPLVALLENSVREGFLRSEHLRGIVVAADAGELLERLAQTRPPHVPKWLDRNET